MRPYEIRKRIVNAITFEYKMFNWLKNKLKKTKTTNKSKKGHLERENLI